MIKEGEWKISEDEQGRERRRKGKVNAHMEVMVTLRGAGNGKAANSVHLK